MTRMFRDFALEGQYEYALSGLVESFEGLGYDRAVSILKGTHRLNGASPRYVNDVLTENTIGIEEDHEAETAEYLEELQRRFDGCVRNGLSWYEPYAWIDGYGIEDMPKGVKSVAGPDLATARARHYMDDAVKDKTLYVTRDRVDNAYSAGVVAVLYRVRSAPPAWLTVDAPRVTAFGLGAPLFDGPLPPLERRGWSAWYGRQQKIVKLPSGVLSRWSDSRGAKPDPALAAQQEAQNAAEEREDRSAYFAEQDAREEARAAAWEAKDLDYHNRIREQAAEPMGGGFFTLRVERAAEDARPTSYSIPRLPFYCNSQRMNIRLMESVLADKATARLPKWPNVCPPSYKLTMDDQNHSDWMTGATPRIRWDDWYGTRKDEPLHEAVYRAFGEINGDAPGAPLRLSGRGVGCGMAFQPGADPDKVPSHVLEAVLASSFVLVTPTADPKYTSLATHKNCVGIITEVGGSLCHFAVIGREFGLRVLRVENACLRYPSGYDLSVDCDNATVNIIQEKP